MPNQHKTNKETRTHKKNTANKHKPKQETITSHHHNTTNQHNTNKATITQQNKNTKPHQIKARNKNATKQ